MPSELLGERVCSILFFYILIFVDSTTLAYVLSTLNKRYNYGLDLYLLSIDEGIVGYRDGSLETVKQNAIDYDLPLEIISYKVRYILNFSIIGFIWLHHG